MNRALAFAFLVTVSTGCRCQGPIGEVTATFRAAPVALEFERVLENDSKTLTVVLTADTRLGLTIAASTEAPFSVAETFALAGGGEVEVPVTFTAGATERSGTLTLTSGDQVIHVTLHGTGVRPLDCKPTAPCRVSTYSLEADACLEQLASDDVACDPQDVCLEAGRCKAGVCLGVSRRCDDGNVCTIDGCAMSVGCVHTQRACPTPANPCHVATCDPQTGCGETLAPNTTPCGSLDCNTVHICVNGTCTELATPDNTPCGLEMACLPAGTCQSHQCVRADAGEWLPRWSASISGVPAETTPALLSNGAALFFTQCALTVDAGDDGGTATACGLSSYTSSGFERYTTTFDDGRDRQLVHVSARGVLLATDGGVEYRSTGTGRVVESLAIDRAPGIDSVAAQADASVLLTRADGTVVSWEFDGGLAAVATLGEVPVISLDSDGTLYAYEADAGVLSRASWNDDAGHWVFEQVAVDAGLKSLTVSRGVIAAGSQAVTATADGGFVVHALDDGDWKTQWLTRARLQTSELVTSFGWRCPLPLVSCIDEERSLWVVTHSLHDGVVSWEYPVLSHSGRLVEMALLDLPRGTGVAVLAEFVLDGGSRAALGALGDGGVLLFCPLPESSTNVRSAVFAAGALTIMIGQGDGGFRLESYDLKALPVHALDWRAAEGVNGSRRAE